MKQKHSQDIHPKNRSLLKYIFSIIKEILMWLATFATLCSGTWMTISHDGDILFVIGTFLLLLSFFFIFLFLATKIPFLEKTLIGFFLNLTAPKKNYKFVRKEVIYEFSDRTHMRYEKIFCVKPTVSHFRPIIDDKYNWTGKTSLTIKPQDEEHWKIEVCGTRFGLTRYQFSPTVAYMYKLYNKGEKFKLASVIEDIEDTEKKSSLHLSSGIYEKTDLLILRVVFNPDLKPVNGRKYEFVHYTDDEHYDSDKLPVTFNSDTGKKELKWEIENPLYGGKYVIDWEFEN